MSLEVLASTVSSIHTSLPCKLPHIDNISKVKHLNVDHGRRKIKRWVIATDRVISTFEEGMQMLIIPHAIVLYIFTKAIDFPYSCVNFT